LQGVLAQAKNGDELFWEEKFHAANGKARACTQNALLFILLILGGGKGFFFHFSLVPNAFPLNLQWVLGMGCPIEVTNRIILFIFFLYQVLLHDTLCGELHSSGSPSSHYVTQHVLHSTSLLSLLSHMLWQMLSSFHLYIGGPMVRNSILQSTTFNFREPP
jgi:hypothetical protein